MRRGVTVALLACFIGLCGHFAPAAAGTFTKLNEGDPHPSWGVSRINNLGHVAMTRATTSAYSGPAYLWTGFWGTLTVFPGSSVGNDIFQPQMELNDQDRIAYRAGGEAVRVAGLSGVITLGAAPTSLNYIIDINNNNRIAAFSWASSYNNRIYGSDDPYTSYTLDVGPGDLHTYHVANNDSNQIAWRPSTLVANIYRFTPGVGSVVIGSSEYSPFDMDNGGHVIHVRAKNSIMLDNIVLRRSAAVWRNLYQFAQPRISDNGKHVVWTEFDGTRWNLWTLVDGIPTDLTQGAYSDVLSPDVNDDGSIVFASAENLWVAPYVSNVYLYTSSDPEPIVYNGHFDGETWFGWETPVSGAARVDLVARAGGGFAAQLTSGSPAGIEQAIDLPDDAATLEFDFDFLSTGGILTVSLGGFELVHLGPADDTEPGFTHRAVPILSTPPLGESGAVLSFVLDGPAGSVVQLDGIRVTAAVTGAPEGSSSPLLDVLGAAHPNPFTIGTSVSYRLQRAGRVHVAAFDAHGRRVAVVLDEWRAAGPGTFTWNGRNSAGDLLAPGAYFLRMQAGSAIQTRKAILVR